MNICYVDMWSGFDPNCNWFNLVFKEIFNDKEINFNSTPEEADIIFLSSFGNTSQQYKNYKAIKIFYTGENERANFSVADYSLSFDYDTYGGKNFRLPHWFMYINWWGEPNFPHARISKDQLFHRYDPEEVWNRENFCSIIIGNPVQNRIEIAQKLNEYKPVHGFGRVFGNYYSECKVDLMKGYRYNICFENSIYEGYTTEKLLEAKVAGCVPIYYGHVSTNNDFNKKCFLNLYTSYTSVDQLQTEIIKIDTNKDYFIRIAAEELFNSYPDLTNLYNFLKYICKR